MATNQVFSPPGGLTTRRVVCSQPATPAPGNPVLFGQIPGVALTGEDTDGYTTIAEDGTFELSVQGADGSGNAAVADGDILYYDAAATVKINKDATNGVRFGYAAVGTGGTVVASGATATIRVKVGY